MKVNIDSVNPLVFAWVGDAYFSYRVREFLSGNIDAKSGKLHSIANKFVSARAQAKIFNELACEFDENENDIARRAKNCHNNNIAKNSSTEEYKRATALEAIVGFHVMNEDFERLEILFSFILKEGVYTLNDNQS